MRYPRIPASLHSLHSQQKSFNSLSILDSTLSLSFNYGNAHYSNSRYSLPRPMGSTRFRNPRARGCGVPSEARAPLGNTPWWALSPSGQPRGLGFLNRLDPLVLASNLYVATF